MAARLKTRLCRGELYLCLMLPAVIFAVVDFDLTILHTNDIHARIEETDKYGAPCTPILSAEGKCFGGSSRIRTMVRKKRDEFPGRTLLLDAGDQFQGSLWFYLFGGMINARFMNLIRYDAMAIGNHEFDNGIIGIVPFARNLTFPLLSSNMNVNSTPELINLVKKSAIFDLGGHKIGIVGYTTTSTPYISRPETVTFVEELEAIQEEIDKLEAKGINKIIALGHSGYAEDLNLARLLRNVDIVVGGHTNTFLYNGTPPSNEKAEGSYPTVVKSVHKECNVLVVQDYAFGKYLGELHVSFDSDGEILSWSGNPILLDHSVQKDNETEALIQIYLPELEKMKTGVIGHSYVDLMADRLQCRTTECSLGNLVADAIVQQNLHRSDEDSWSDAAIAIINAGSLRSSIQQGPITIESVINVQPFRNTIDIVEINGTTLFAILEFCASKWTERSDNEFGGFLQVSGLQITYDMKRPVNERVLEVLAVCTKCKVPQMLPVKSKEIYRVLASSFIIGGGDGYSMLPGSIIKVFPVGNIDTDMLMEYVKKFTPITMGLHQRIRHLHDLSKSIRCVENSGTKLSTFFSFTAKIICLISLWSLLC